MQFLQGKANIDATVEILQAITHEELNKPNKADEKFVLAKLQQKMLKIELLQEFVTELKLWSMSLAVETPSGKMDQQLLTNQLMNGRLQLIVAKVIRQAEEQILVGTPEARMVFAQFMNHMEQ